MQTKKKDPVLNLVAGGIAGFTESLCCHPLDTIKTRVQLANSVVAARERSSHRRSGAMLVATKLVQSEGFFALYSGLSAVMAGIVPKMAVRFSSFDIFKGWLGDREGRNKGGPVRYFVKHEYVVLLLVVYQFHDPFFPISVQQKSFQFPPLNAQMATDVQIFLVRFTKLSDSQNCPIHKIVLSARKVKPSAHPVHSSIPYLVGCFFCDAGFVATSQHNSKIRV